MRILLVEDSPTQSRILRDLLERSGYEVEIARDGIEGFERFTRGSFGLVISDVVMPGLNGYDLCRKIKQASDGRNTPVVLVTALNTLKDLIEGIRSGADNFITKPVDPTYLLSRIRTVLDNRKEGEGALCDPQTGVCFLDKSFINTLDRKRILDYLVSTFDDFLHMREVEGKRQLEAASQRLKEIEDHELKVTELAGQIVAGLEELDETLATLTGADPGQLPQPKAELVAGLRKRNRDLIDLMETLTKAIGGLARLSSDEPEETGLGIIGSLSSSTYFPH